MLVIHMKVPLAAPGLDQVADIDAAAGRDAIKRATYLLVRLLLAEHSAGLLRVGWRRSRITSSRDTALAAIFARNYINFRLNQTRGAGDTPDCGGIDVRNWHEGEAEGGAKPVLLCPRSSDVNLFSYGQGIIDFDAEM